MILERVTRPDTNLTQEIPGRSQCRQTFRSGRHETGLKSILAPFIRNDWSSNLIRLRLLNSLIPNPDTASRLSGEETVSPSVSG